MIETDKIMFFTIFEKLLFLNSQLDFFLFSKLIFSIIFSFFEINLVNVCGRYLLLN